MRKKGKDSYVVVKRDVTVLVRCISCGVKRRVGPYEVPAGELPFCKECGDICVAVRGESRRHSR